MYKVFVSMRFKDRTEEEVKNILTRVEAMFLEWRLPEENGKKIKAICNYWCIPPKKQNKKLYQLSNALYIMSECEEFVLIKDKGKPIPKGCELELEAWKTSKSILCDGTILDRPYRIISFNE